MVAHIYKDKIQVRDSNDDKNNVTTNPQMEYVKDKWYSFKIIIDASSSSYNVYVKSEDDADYSQFADNYDFYSSGVSTLNEHYFGIEANQQEGFQIEYDDFSVYTVTNQLTFDTNLSNANLTRENNKILSHNV